MAQELWLLVLLLNLWATYDVLRRPVVAGHKLMWLALVWLFPYVGWLLYVLLGRSYLAKRESGGVSGY